MIYRRNADGGLQLESAAFGDGRIMVSEGSNGTIYTPNYFITDHLGSTRAVVTADGTVIEQNDYYPFGSRHENPQLAVSDNRFRFSGKEDQTIGDLPYQDFTARFFGKKLPIFTTPDPMAKDYPWISPYAYCLNNPLRYIDPNGMWIVGADGKRVFYSLKSGWSKNASADVIRVGNAMMATKTGLEVFQKIYDHSAKVNISISQESRINQNSNGTLNLTRGSAETSTLRDGNKDLVEANIVIYEGTIIQELSGLTEPRDPIGILIQSLPENIAVDAVIGSVGVHEVRHLEPENIQQVRENSAAIDRGEPKIHDVEKDPREWQYRYLKELLNQ